MAEKVYGKSTVRSKGVLKVGGGQKGNRKPHLMVPYSLLNSKDFLSLDELAVKVYFIMLRQWKTNDPDKPVEISFDRLRELCSKKNTEGEMVKPGYTRLTKVIKQLMTVGFIHKVVRHKQCNRYWIEQKWFTGEYR